MSQESQESYNKRVIELLERIVEQTKPKIEPKTEPNFKFECEGCGYLTENPKKYLDHVAVETIKNYLKDYKVNPKEFIKECEGDICKIIDERIEAHGKKEERKPWF